MRHEQAEKSFKVSTDFYKDEKAFEVDGMEYRQYDSLQEAITDAGSDENLLEYINRSVKSDSLIGVRNYITSIKKKADISVASIIDRVREIRKGFSLAASATRVTKDEKLAMADSISKFATEMDPDATITKADLLKLLNAR